MTQITTLAGLGWVADAPGNDATARYTACVTINDVPFRLVAHRVQRPAAAGWIDDRDLEGLPCDADGAMAMDGETSRRWWQDFEALPDGDTVLEIQSMPEVPSETEELADQHHRLWKTLCSWDDSQQVWKRQEGAYLIFGWPMVHSASDAEVTVAFEPVDIDGWAQGHVSIEGVPCLLSGPVANWEASTNSWSRPEDHERWKAEMEAITGEAIIPMAYPDKAHPQVFASLSPQSD